MISVLDIWSIFIPALLLPFVINRPIITVKNYTVIMIVAPLVIGALLIPYSLEMEYIDYSAVKKAAWLISVSLSFFLLTLIYLDKWKKKIPLKKPAHTFSMYILRRWENVSDIRLFTVFFLFSFTGVLFILITFLKTGNIPYCNAEIDSKYFDGSTDLYVPLRPFYTAGQQILSIISLVMLLAVITKISIKRVLLFMPLYFFALLILILTLKRGEMIFSVVIILGAIFFSGRASKYLILTALAIFIAVFYLAIITDSQANRPFQKLICSEGISQVSVVPNVFAAEKREEGAIHEFSQKNIITKKEHGNPVKAVLINHFGIQIRDSARLIYHFDKGEAEFFKGRTFLAGLLGFIPTKYSAFKEKYQIGRVTLRLYGLNPEISGGPRIGLMGEAYINFGYLGVLLIPLLPSFLAWYLCGLSDDSRKIERAGGRIFLASLYFFLLNHLVVGFFGDGSAAFQTFIIRTAIMAVVFFLLFYPVKRAET